MVSDIWIGMFLARGARFAQRFRVASRRTLLAMTDRVFALLRNLAAAHRSIRMMSTEVMSRS
jgi:hypothetical protein